MRLGWLLLGLAACEGPDVIDESEGPSRDRSVGAGVCFAEVLWDGDAWTVEITRDAHDRLISAVYDHGDYVDVREAFSGECMRWSDDLAPRPRVAPEPREVPGPIDVEPPGLFAPWDP